MTLMRIENRDVQTTDIFEIIIDNFPDIIHSVDAEGNIVFANNTAEGLLGYPLEALLTMNVRDLYSEEVLQDLERGFDSLKKTGEVSVESVLKDKDGNRIPVEIRSFSIYDDQGNFIRTFSILRDIRNIKELQNSLIHAGRLTAIGELASGIVHDINNPLSIITLSAQGALMDLQDMTRDAKVGAKIQEGLEDILRATESVTKLVSHLRNFSRGMAEAKEPIDLGQSITDALFLTKSRVDRSLTKVHNHIARRTYYTTGCPSHIEQVFANLISNACDAMQDSDERNLTLTIDAYTDDEGKSFWRCDVLDTGTGIPESLQQEVFRTFFTTKEKGKGTGLGLSITRGIVTDHGGSVKMHSEEGVGTRFTICLPQAEI